VRGQLWDDMLPDGSEIERLVLSTVPDRDMLLDGREIDALPVAVMLDKPKPPDGTEPERPLVGVDMEKVRLPLVIRLVVEMDKPEAENVVLPLGRMPVMLPLAVSRLVVDMDRPDAESVMLPLERTPVMLPPFVGRLVVEMDRPEAAVALTLPLGRAPVMLPALVERGVESVPPETPALFVILVKVGGAVKTVLTPAALLAASTPTAAGPVINWVPVSELSS
jgi:hypothetical protein